jgi:hypothetical protein
MPHFLNSEELRGNDSDYNDSNDDDDSCDEDNIGHP